MPLNNHGLDKRLEMRESFARWFAVLLVIIAAALIQRIIPTSIDYKDPSQMLYIGQISGTVFGWVTAACAFFFFIQASEHKQRDAQRSSDPPVQPADPGEGAP